MSSAEHVRQEALDCAFRCRFAATFVFGVASRLVAKATVAVLSAFWVLLTVVTVVIALRTPSEHPREGAR